MRQLTDHIVEGDSANHQVTVEVLDEPGQGGACHKYVARWTPKWDEENASLMPNSVALGFQNGPIKEFGVNGITHEVLLTIVIDRLRSFQAGPYACRDNGVALAHLEEGLMWLQRRTRERIKRGVEGTHQK